VKYLLDTSVFLWAIGPYELLSQKAQDILDSGQHDLFLSAASSWEIAIKSSIDKLPLPEPAAQYVSRMLLTTGIRSLPITHIHALAVADLPRHHTDPFDRMLVAQAQLERMVLLTTDKNMLKYDVATLWCAR
jgi:PIN domain nuclease of toxin-antitoxin system